MDTRRVGEPGGSPAPQLETKSRLYYWAQVLEPPTTLPPAQSPSGEVISAQAAVKAAAAMTSRVRRERRMIGSLEDVVKSGYASKLCPDRVT